MARLAQAHFLPIPWGESIVEALREKCRELRNIAGIAEKLWISTPPGYGVLVQLQLQLHLPVCIFFVGFALGPVPADQAKSQASFGAGGGVCYITTHPCLPAQKPDPSQVGSAQLPACHSSPRPGGATFLKKRPGLAAAALWEEDAGEKGCGPLARETGGGGWVVAVALGIDYP